MEALLGIGVYLWWAISIFHSVKSLLIALEKVNVVWCSRDYSESANKAIKWVTSVVKNGSGYLSKVPPNVDACILHYSFTIINE